MYIFASENREHSSLHESDFHILACCTFDCPIMNMILNILKLFIMKKENISINFSALRRSAVALVLTAFLVVSGLSAFAAQDPITSLPEGTITYIGTLDGQPVFQVAFDNSNGAVRTLVIKDGEGSILYSEKIKAEAFSKKFKFERADRNNVKLTFVLWDGKEQQSQEFVVNNSTQVVSNLVVTKL